MILEIYKNGTYRAINVQFDTQIWETKINIKQIYNKIDQSLLLDSYLPRCMPSDQSSSDNVTTIIIIINILMVCISFT